MAARLPVPPVTGREIVAVDSTPEILRCLAIFRHGQRAKSPGRSFLPKPHCGEPRNIAQQQGTYLASGFEDEMCDLSGCALFSHWLFCHTPPWLSDIVGTANCHVTWS